MNNIEEALVRLAEAETELTAAQENLKVAKNPSTKAQYILDALVFYEPKLFNEKPHNTDSHLIEIEMDGQYHLFESPSDLLKIAQSGYYIGGVVAIKSTNNSRIRVRFFSL